MDPLTCGHYNGHWFTGPDVAACLACRNLKWMHNRDFRYSAGGVSLEFYWNVIWEVPAHVRSECKAQDVETIHELMACMATGAMDGWNAKLSEHRYAGTRIGMDFLEKMIVPRMIEDPNVFIVFNMHWDFQDNTTITNLVDMLKRYERPGVDLIKRVIAVAGGVVLHNQQEKERHEALRNASIPVLDIMPLLKMYSSAEFPPDPEGDPFDDLHLGPVTQRLLLKHVLTHVAYSRFRAGNVSAPPTPVLCSK